MRFARIYLDAAPLCQEDGMNLGCYSLPTYGDYTIAPGTTATLNTGICLEIPSGYIGVVAGHDDEGVFAVLADHICSDYKDEIRVVVQNLTDGEIRLPHGFLCAS